MSITGKTTLLLIFVILLMVIVGYSYKRNQSQSPSIGISSLEEGKKLSKESNKVLLVKVGGEG